MSRVKKPLRTAIDRSFFRSFANLVCADGHYSYAPHSAMMMMGSECFVPLSANATAIRGRCRAELSLIEGRK